ncbi:alpha/beta hydrolase [Hyphobacterium sp. CCMP332]|nr:alpha/beta hydrolase [Hyphobacterium sp. CCMP332]
MKKRALLISLVIIALFIIFLNSCMQFRISDEVVRREFNETGISVGIHYFQFENSQIRYIKTGRDRQNLIIFIHGAPGSSQDYYHFLMDSTMVSICSMVAIDRPGYGYSDFGKSEKSIKRQAEMLKKLINEELSSFGNIVLIGHSFGGPIAGIMAYQNDTLIDKVIMLAPAIDPDREIIFWISYLAKWPPFRWLTPRVWTVASDEKFSHKAALSEIEGMWAEISTNIVHVHGTKDILVPYENVWFTEKNIPEEYLEIKTIKGANHFLPWTHPELIKKLIIESLNQD